MRPRFFVASMTAEQLVVEETSAVEGANSLAINRSESPAEVWSRRSFLGALLLGIAGCATAGLAREVFPLVQAALDSSGLFRARLHLLPSQGGIVLRTPARGLVSTNPQGTLLAFSLTSETKQVHLLGLHSGQDERGRFRYVLLGDDDVVGSGQAKLAKPQRPSVITSTTVKPDYDITWFPASGSGELPRSAVTLGRRLGDEELSQLRSSIYLTLDVARATQAA